MEVDNECVQYGTNTTINQGIYTQPSNMILQMVCSNKYRPDTTQLLIDCIQLHNYKYYFIDVEGRLGVGDSCGGGAMFCF